MKFLSSFIGRAKLCALGRRLCPVCSLSQKWCLRTWHGLELIDLNSPRSTSRANSSNDGESAGRKPPLLSLSRSLSSRLRCSAVVKPHYAGEAYSREATVVSLAPVAALEDEGHATEEFLRQTVMTHMMIVFDLYDRSCSVVGSRSPPTLSKYRRVWLLV